MFPIRLIKKNLFLASLVFMCFPDLAEASTSILNPADTHVSSDGTVRDSFEEGVSYKVERDMRVEALEAFGAEGAIPVTHPNVLLPKGSSFVVLGNKILNGNKVVEIGLDTDVDEPDSSSDQYSHITVDYYQLVQANPHFAKLELQEFSEDGFYETDVAGKGKARKRKGMTYCYRNVKNYLMSHCGVKTYLPGSAAYQAASILPQYGFSRVSNGFDGHESMQSCTVCVLSGGSHRCGKSACGDVVVKKGPGAWYGWGTRATPYLSGRTPIACFHK